MNEVLQWHVTRELNYKPKHFTVTNTPITKESLLWIAHKLVGRYHLMTDLSSDSTLVKKPAFEDHAEAMLYELTWS
jgi:hypothetical protein